MPNFVIPMMAVKYDGPAAARLGSQKSYLDAVQSTRAGQICWSPATLDWFEGLGISYCESSLAGRGEMFGSVRHPRIAGTPYYEGVWLREFFSLPNALLIFAPYPGVIAATPLVYTIGVYNKDWVENLVDAYSKMIKETSL
jgi:hypothetical protein